MQRADDNLMPMATKRAWGIVVLAAAVLWIAAALVLPGNASAHLGHGAPVAAGLPTAAASDDLALASNDGALPFLGILEDVVSALAATGKQVPATDCPRSCCAGSSACAGAYALDLPVIDFAPPKIQRMRRLATAATGEGVTPQALPEPPRSS